MGMKRWAIRLLTVATLAANAMSPLAISAADTIKIGGHYELSGDVASYGEQMDHGSKLAIDLANQEGKILGKTLEYFHLDNKSDSSEAASVAERMIREGVVGVAGPATVSLAKVQMPKLDEAKIPNILPAGTQDDLIWDGNHLNEFLYRVCFTDSDQGVAGAVYSIDQLGAKKAAVLFDNTTQHAQGISDAFDKAFEKMGGEIVTRQGFDPKEQDFSAILSTVQASNPDVIYAPGFYTAAGLIIKQAREMGIDCPIVGSEGYSSDKLYELAGQENMDKIYYVEHFAKDTDSPEAKKFLEEFKKAYGKEGSTFNALGYDATNLLIEAIKIAQSEDPVEINKALAQIKDFKGVTGTFSVDEHHNVDKVPIMVEVHEGAVTGYHQVDLSRAQ